MKDAFGTAKRVRADMAAGGPESRAREAAEKEARYSAFLGKQLAAAAIFIGLQRKADICDSIQTLKQGPESSSGPVGVVDTSTITSWLAKTAGKAYRTYPERFGG